jgi:hypothetical protein
VIDSSLEGVADVVSKYLSGPPARSLRLAPWSSAVIPARLTRAAQLMGAHGAPEDDPPRADEGPVAHDARAVLAVAQAPGAGAARLSRLDNGLTLIVLRRPGLPFVSMLLGFHADPRPDETPGVRQAVTLGRQFRLVRGPLERAILQTSFLDRDAFGEHLGMFSYSEESAMDLLSRETVTFMARWPAPSAAGWLGRAKLAEATIVEKVSFAFRAALFGDHPYRQEVRAADVALRGGTQMLGGVVDADPRAVALALAVGHEWLDASGTATPSPQAVERARWAAARGSGLRAGTNEEMARQLFEAWNMGWDLASLDAFPRDLASVTSAEVTAALDACRASAVISVIGGR